MHSMPNLTDELQLDPSGIQTEPRYASLASMVEVWAQRTPDALAVSQATRSWTYAQLTASANAIATLLSAGEVVALTGQQSFGLVAAMLAVLSSRSVLLTIDSNLPEHRQKLLVEQAGARHLLVVGEMPAWMRSHSWSNVIQIDPSNPPSGNNTTPFVSTLPDDPAYIFFTSGSTGGPKGVLGTQKGLSHFLAWQSSKFQVGPGDRVAQLTNLSFDAILRAVFLALVSGGTLCLPSEPSAMAAAGVFSWLEEARVTLMHTVPSLAQTWLTDIPADVHLPELRLVFFSGESLHESLIRRWRLKFPAGRIVNLYGPTETTMVKFFYEVPGEPDPGVQPAGWPLPETESLLLNEQGALCGVGEIGEILVRTPFRTLGYINAPEEQQRRFIRNPFRDDPSDLLYRTGDRGRYRADGALEILGRLDDQLKIQGVRVEPDEVAATLMQHPAVRSCAVIAQTGPSQRPTLVAYVVGAGISATGLREYLSKELPAPMIPSTFVLLEHLPLNSNGKVDRKALPAPTVTHSFVAPQTQLEQVLAGLWQQALGVGRVGLEDNFFELGGDSLRLAQVHGKLRALGHPNLLITDLFQHPTIKALAAHLSRETPKKSAASRARLRAARQVASRTGQPALEEDSE
jgi:amino acid adenylation domain-containing protein